MKKLICFYISILSLAFFEVSFALPEQNQPNLKTPPSLRFLATKKAFDFKNDPNQREILKQIL